MYQIHLVGRVNGFFQEIFNLTIFAMKFMLAKENASSFCVNEIKQVQVNLAYKYNMDFIVTELTVVNYVPDTCIYGPHVMYQDRYFLTTGYTSAVPQFILLQAQEIPILIST